MPDPVSRALAACPLYFILDESMFAVNDPAAITREVISAGVRIIQLRVKTLGDAEFSVIARQLSSLCGDDCLLIINDRPDIALECGAHGVHVGAEDNSVLEVRRQSASLLIGASAPTPIEALNAERDGADYLGSGAVFSSPTKPDRVVIGPGGLTEVVEAVDIPVVGIGGISIENCQQVIAAGAKGFCSISPFSGKQQMGELIAEFNSLFNGAES